MPKPGYHTPEVYATLVAFGIAEPISQEDAPGLEAAIASAISRLPTGNDPVCGSTTRASTVTAGPRRPDFPLSTDPILLTPGRQALE
jgi:hypothetical protein